MAENTLGIAVHDHGHLAYSKVEMEVQADEHVAFSTQHSSLMWREKKKKESKAEDQLHFMGGGLLVEGNGPSWI